MFEGSSKLINLWGRILIGVIFASMAGSCSDSAFHSATPKKAPLQKELTAELTLPPIVTATATPAPPPPPIPSERSGTGSIGDLSCKESLDYESKSISCNIPVSGDHIWRKSDGWKTLVNNFPDGTAAFISPLASQGKESDTHCPMVPNVEKLIYVAYVNIPTAGSYKYSAIIDDIGYVHMWRRSDPGKEVALTLGSGATMAQDSVNLEATGYAIVVQATDNGKIATGMAFTLQNSAGNVIKHSIADGTWCIFRVPASTEPSTYLPPAAGCRACFGGNNP